MGRGFGSKGRASGWAISVVLLITSTGFSVEQPENNSSAAIDTTLNKTRLGE